MRTGVESESSKAALTDAVAALYRAFSKRRLKHGFIERCSPVGARRALAGTMSCTPLEQIDASAMATYCFKSMLTMGDTEDFLHFVPRMLDLYATQREWHEHPSNLLRKIDEVRETHIAVAESKAIDALLHAAWRNALYGGLDTPRAGGLLLDFTDAGMDAAPWLASFQPSSVLRDLLAAVDVLESTPFFGGKSREVIGAWIDATDLETLLFEASDAITDEAVVHRLLRAIETIELLRLSR